MANAPKHAAPKHAAPAPAVTQDIEIPEKPHSRKLWLIPVILAGVLGGTYVGGSVYFMSHFLPNTTVDGIDVSLQEPTVLSEHIDEASLEYHGTFKGDGFEIPFTAADIDYAYDGEAYANEAMAQQNPWSWPLEFQNNHDLNATLSATFDASKAWNLFAPVVEQSAATLASLPHRGIVFDDASDHYIVSDEARSAMLDQAAVIAKAEEGIAAEAETIEIGEDCYIVDPETQAFLDAANFYADAKVHLTMNGVDAIDVTGKQISQWLTLNDDGTVTLNEQAILDWGPGGLSDILDSVGKPRTYTRPDGVEITVTGDEGTYGWLINGAESSKLILAAIKSGQPQTVAIPTYQNAAQVNPGGQDWPDKYVDVDISEQTARVYVDGKEVMSADLVTGIPDSKFETPRGVYYITEHEEQVDLYNPGEVPEGANPDYDHFELFPGGWYSHVDYWMAFIGSSTGLHNSDWRTQYGKDGDGDYIYLYNGSHGCINMSYDSAQQMYGITELGDVVVVHD